MERHGGFGTPPDIVGGLSCKSKSIALLRRMYGELRRGRPVFRSGIRCKPHSRNFVANRIDRNGQASGFGAQRSVGQIASEIRLGRPRRIGIFPRVPLEVFSTNHFRPAVRILHIRHGCCPRRREDIFILDSELELQVFT